MEHAAKFSDVIQYKFFELLSAKELFRLLTITKRHFNLIASLLLQKKEEEAYFYQARLLKMLFEMKDETLSTLLKSKVGSISLAQKIKDFSDGMHVEGKVTLYGWVLYAKHVNPELKLNARLIALFTQAQILGIFSTFLTKEQSQSSKKELLREKIFQTMVRTALSSELAYVDDKKAALKIKIPTEENKGVGLLSLTKKGLDHPSEEVQYKAWKAFVELIGLSFALNSADEILCLILKGFNHSSERVQTFAFQALTLYIQKGLDHSSEWLQTLAFQALTHYIERFDPLDPQANEILLGVMKCLRHPSFSIKEMAMHAFGAFVKKNMPVTLEMCQEGLKNIWQVILAIIPKESPDPIKFFLEEYNPRGASIKTNHSLLFKQSIHKNVDAEQRLQTGLNILTLIIKHGTALVRDTHKIEMPEGEEALDFFCSLASTMPVQEQRAVSGVDSKTISSSNVP